MRALIAFFLLCLAVAAYAQDQQPVPVLSGYVTRLASAYDFDVNAIHILCGPDTLVESKSGNLSYAGCSAVQLTLGEAVDVYGHSKKKLNAIVATRIDFKPLTRDGISGYAVIDAVAATGSTTPGAIQIRADGYPILITANTAVTFNPPLNSRSDIMTNVWVDYDAVPGPGRAFVAQSAKFSQNFITDREDAMRAKTDYDPSVVPLNANPDTVAVAVGLGPDPKRIPPWPDATMQIRLNSIGQRLIPDYQKRLPASDPSKINFRFQLTDGERWPWVIALPSGVILVPNRIVERMQNDSQLAAILADAIACALEKQTYRMRIANAATSAASVASWAAIVPVIGTPALLAGIGGGTSQAIIVRKEEHQSGLVSLDLLHDAGYDLSQAPIARWLLASRKPKPYPRFSRPTAPSTSSEHWASSGKIRPLHHKLTCFRSLLSHRKRKPRKAENLSSLCGKHRSNNSTFQAAYKPNLPKKIGRFYGQTWYSGYRG
jgi:hypothetical protein